MRIVIVSDPKRKDFHGYLIAHLKSLHEIFILWNYKPHDEEVFCETKYLYWKDYSTPKQFLLRIKPDRIVFFEIIDFWQIPLIIACHQYKVTSFFLEHGVGNSIEQVQSRFLELSSVKERWKIYSNKLVSNFFRILKNRIFFYSVLSYLQTEELKKYLKLPVYYKKHTPLHALSKLKFRKRTPHFAILFNRNNVEPFLLYNEIEKENIFTEGVPFFDKYYYYGKESTGNHIVFIEHPYLEEGILNWSPQFHEFVAKALESFAKERKIKLIIKLHPRSDIRNWFKYNLNEQFITIRQKEDVTQELLSAKLVLSYSSTLMNVLLACRKNTVLLGWHPKPLIFGDDFSKSGLCHVSFYPQELMNKFDQWIADNKTISNANALDAFLKEYNYPFDGKATERVIKTITEHEVH